MCLSGYRHIIRNNGLGGRIGIFANSALVYINSQILLFDLFSIYFFQYITIAILSHDPVLLLVYNSKFFYT